MNNDIEVFQDEAKAGLFDAIKNNIVLSNSQVFSNKKGLDNTILNNLSIANLSLPDLYPINAILASTGLNLNDDFFDSEETYAAKDSPVDKPFNFEHKSSDIIGHILSSSISTFDGKVYSGEKAPESFDIPFQAVIYRHFHDDKNKQEKINKIIAALENPTEDDKWFVSMECRFKGFDYLLVPSNDFSSAQVIQRNNDTAFLTKHLRTFGGNGTYKDNKLGRFLRNITFSAVGLVRHPGNPRSIISSPSKGTTSGKIHTKIETLGYTINSEEIMNEVEKLKADLAKTQSDLTKANMDLAEMQKSVAAAEKTNWEKKYKDMAEAMDDLKKQLDKEKSEKEASKSEAQVATSALDTLKTTNKDLTEQLNKFKSEAEKAEADRKNVLRLAQVKEAYAISNDEEAKKVATPLTALTDEAFAAHIDAIKNINKVKVDNTAKVDPKQATAALNDAKPVVEPALNAGVDTNSEGEALASELDKFFGLSKDDNDSGKKKKKNKK